MFSAALGVPSGTASGFAGVFAFGRLFSIEISPSLIAAYAAMRFQPFRRSDVPDGGGEEGL